MNFDYGIEIKGLAALTRKLGAAQVGAMIRELTLDTGKEVQKIIAVEPRPSHRPVIWASEKQRRWYFWWRTSHGWPLPYTRNTDESGMSERIKASWKTVQRGQDAVVGTPASYARWVQNGGVQQPMHRVTGWITDQQAILQAQQEGAAERVWQRILGSWVKE